jgi:hypothetical protein
MKKVLGEIKSEVTVLSRTESILMNRADNLDEFMKTLEQQKGISGYSNVNDELKIASNTNAYLNEKKD